MEHLYDPTEDSFLLWRTASKFLEKNAFSGIKILDMGTGTGYIIKNVAEFLHKKGVKADLWASDIVEVKLPGIHFLLSNLFQNIPGKFNLILFNPPYLPTGERDACLGEEKRNLIGGKKGNEVVLQFLEQLPVHLETKGNCLLIASTLSHPEEIEKKAHEQGFSCQKIAEESFDFEKIFVYLIKRK